MSLVPCPPPCLVSLPWFSLTVLVKPVPHSNPDRYHRDVRWSYNSKLPEAEAAQGCPVKSGAVDQTCVAIKNSIALRKSPQKHARAMSIEDMDAMYGFSLRECPNFQSIVPERGPVPLAALKLVTLHLFWRAFSSLSFVLWTRKVPLDCQLGTCRH